jgi:threonine 3-dehydrogenase
MRMTNADDFTTSPRVQGGGRTMKAIVKRRPVPGEDWPEGLSLEEVPVPQVTHPEDVQLCVLAAGICGTDVGIWQSRDSLRESMARAASSRIVIGHEFCGTITDAGAHARVRTARILNQIARHDPFVREFTAERPPDALAQDDSLIDFLGKHFYSSAEMHLTCGWCHQCSLGHRHVCQNTLIKGIHEDGTFAGFVVVPASNLVLFRRDELPMEVIAFMDALGNAVHSIQAVDVTGKSVVVLGSGVQGLMATAVARHSGASHIWVTDFSPPSAAAPDLARFDLARRFGADACFNVAIPESRETLHALVMEETRGTGADAILEMSGSYGAYADAFQLVRMGGTIGLLGLPEGEYALDFARNVIFRGLTVRGIIGRRVFETWEVMRNLLRRGLAQELVESGFVSHLLPLEDYEIGMNAIRRREAVKVILRP